MSALGLRRFQTLLQNLQRELQLNQSILVGHRAKVRRSSDFTANAYTLTTDDSGCVVLLDEAPANTITLPAITAGDIGVSYTFVQTAASNNDNVINTAYNNDYFIGGLVQLPSAVWAAGTAQDGLAANIVPGSTDTQITFDDNLANCMGGVGSMVTLTAILTGNTGAGGGSKFVWMVTGTVYTADPNSDGTAIFT